MKIAILTPWSISSDAVGGTERFVMDLANSFVKLGNIVDVYMLSGKEYEKNGVYYKNINLFNTNETIDEYYLKNKFNNFELNSSYESLAKRIEELVDFDNYDMIHLNSQLFLRVCQNKKRVFTIHTNPFEYKLDWGEEAFNTMLKIMYEESLFVGTRFITPSEYYANEYNKLTSVNVGFIPHAINIERLKNKNSTEKIKKDLNIEINKKVILLPSRLEPIQKQPMLFMKAFAKVDNEIKKQFKVICTGADKQYLKYKDEIEKYCNENNIDILIARFNTMADAYKVADIVVLPSKSESFGYSALESLSLGIPTILNNIPTYKEVADLSNNYYIFNNTIESLYLILMLLLSKKLEKIVQPEEWKNKYLLELFGKRYIDLF